MVTPDKDYGQLISENILQFKPGKSGSENEILDKAKVCEKYNIERPEQVIEILTICGDSSDNVPGVKGVGEVGAGKLLSRFGTVDEIYRHLDELTPKQREAFENAREHIQLSHELVTIRTDVEIDVKFSDMTLNSKYSSEAADLFERHEFGSLKKYLGDVQTTVPVQTNRVSFAETSTDDLKKAILTKKKCSVITEGESDDFFSPVRKVILAVEGNDRKAGVEYLAGEGKIEEFAEILRSPEIVKYGYNLKFQRNIIRCGGMELNGKLMDIELMHYLINPEKSHKIDILARSYLNINLEDNFAEETSATELSLFDEVEEDKEETGTRFHEAVATLMLGDRIWDELKGMSLDRLYMEMEEPLIKVLSEMEIQGVRIDPGQLRRYAASLAGEMNGIQEKVREMAQDPNLNIMSPKQIGVLIFEKLNLDPKVKPKTGLRYSYPTDEDTLAALSDKSPIIDEILEYRGIKKLLSTYIEPFPNYISPKTGKIHTTFNQALTATGRLSSSKPNLQNIPIRTERGKEIRKAFVPSRPDGLIVSADYSQIELRIMAHLSCDTHLIEAFRKDRTCMQ